MKRAICVLIVGIALVGLSGCCAQMGYWYRPIADLLGIGAGTCCGAPETCAGCCDPRCGAETCHVCHGRGCRACQGCDRGHVMAGGPPSAAVTYPYYTLRGPRDFLAANPPSIGP